MLKAIWDCFGFALLCLVIGSENSLQSLHQSDTKLTSNHDLVARVFPRFRQFGFFFYFECYWLLKVFSFLLIGRCINFGFGLTQLKTALKACIKKRAGIKILLP